MDADDLRRLELAYAAFRGELSRVRADERALLRAVERRLRGARDGWPRVPTLVLALLAFSGFAYADTMGSPPQVAEARLLPVATLATDTRVILEARARAEGAGMADSLAFGLAPDRANPSPEPKPLTFPDATSSPRAAPRASSSDLWRRVADGVQRGDTRTAQRALNALAESDDVETRSKAALGLASIALTRGDCERVRQLAGRVEAAHDAGHPLVRRARDLLVRCRAR